MDVASSGMEHLDTAEWKSCIDAPALIWSRLRIIVHKKGTDAASSGVEKLEGNHCLDAAASFGVGPVGTGQV